MEGESFDLKQWREKLGLSQLKTSKLAGLSLTTIRQLEEGAKKPHKKTLKKVQDLISAIETGALDLSTAGRKKRVKSAEDTTDKPSASAAEGRGKGRRGKAPSVEGKPAKRGRPKKSASSEAPAAEAPAKKVRGRKTLATEEPARERHGRPAPTAEFSASTAAASIKLSLIDLELINRMLALSPMEKIDLLKKIP